jgi:hypothetical protein
MDLLEPDRSGNPPDGVVQPLPRVVVAGLRPEHLGGPRGDRDVVRMGDDAEQAPR